MVQNGDGMASERDWAPPGVDTSKANIARVYDYWLGGTNNFLADQDAARALIAVEPNSRAMARANRGFLGRAVRFLAASGIRQFIDVGSGIPTARNVHEVAEEAAPGSRVVYADIDEVVVAHSRALLENNPDVSVIQADLRNPRDILDDPETRRLIDFEKPVGILLAAVLHFIPDQDDPWAIVARLRDAIVPGSYLVLSHASAEMMSEDFAKVAKKVYEGKVAASSNIRRRDSIARLFDGFDLLEPGLVWLPQWRPDNLDDVPRHPEKLWMLAGVGVIPAG
jgi:hypothetical protein